MDARRLAITLTARSGRRWSTVGAGAAGALLGLAVGLPLLPPLQAVAAAALAGIMGAVAVEDTKRFRVPDGLNLLAAAAGFLFAGLAARAEGLDPVAALTEAALHMALCGGALLIVREGFFRLRGVDGLGLGDVKLAAAAGVWLSADRFALAVLLAAVGALGAILVRQRRDGPWPRERKIPFAAYLAPSVWICWLLAQLFPAI